MKPILVILFVFVALWCEGASVAFTDFDTNNFVVNPTGAQPKVTLQQGIATNYTINNLTNTILVSSNVYITNSYFTNITAQTVNNITNINLYSFTTNEYVQNDYVTNETVNYFTVYSNANIVGYIKDYFGIGTNTLIYSPTLVAPVYIVSSNAPVTWSFLDADNSTILGGWNTNLGGY
jgi:hypothetical protein